MTFMTSLLFRGFLVVLLSDPETGADKRTKVNRTHVNRVEIERRSLGGHARRNLMAQCRNHTAKRWYIHYVPNWLSCLASSVA